MKNLNQKCRLVAHPRCGGHWVNCLINLYIHKIDFKDYIHNGKNNVCIHTHDAKLLEKYKNIIYLYRNPVDKIYSTCCFYVKNPEYTYGFQKRYYVDDIFDKGTIIKHINFYIDNINKWIFQDNFTDKKTVISYDLLVNNFDSEFLKILNHFEKQFDADNIVRIKEISKLDIKKKDNQKRIINTSSNYNDNKKIFRNKMTSFIWENIKNKNENVFKFLQGEILL